MKIKALTSIYALIAFIIICAQSCNENEINAELINLCNLESSESLLDHPCDGDLLLSINKVEGTMKYSHDIGFYLQFSVEGSYDCSFIAKICDENAEYMNLVNSKVLFSADVHEYSANYDPQIGGLKQVAISNLMVLQRF